ncbi:cytochrome P450 [Hymenopellis radicata]|nr:cytochrome P450 [Hymenopellis radicata]
MVSQLATVVGGLLICALLVLSQTGRRDRALPPGPPTLPVIGNLHVFPKKVGEMPFKFSELARQYGDIISLKTMSQTMVILSSATAVREVVDKTGWIGSSRNSNYLVHLFTGGIDHLVFAGDTPQVRVMRKVLGSFFSKQNALKNSPVPSESVQLLYELMENHRYGFNASVRRFSHSVVKILICGQRAPVSNSPDVIQYYKDLDNMAHVVAPGAFPPIDLIPILKLVPTCFAPWIPATRAIYDMRDPIHRQLYSNEEKREDGNATCLMEVVMNQPELDPDFASYNSLVSLDGGSDSSGAFLLSVILTLASNPEHEERAWREVDSVVGERLPEYDDLERMPFVKALIKEIQRMRPPFPVGFPHAVTQDVRYKDYVIPKGTSVVLNNYAITNDPEVFENPDEFNPDRFLQTEFGTIPEKTRTFAIRICPGQWVARYTMELTTMRLIWAFQFRDAIASDSKKLIQPGIAAEYFDWEQVVMPHAFECMIKPRPDRAQALKDNYIAALSELQKFEVDLLPSDGERMETLRKELQCQSERA